MNLVPRYDDPRPKNFKSYRQDKKKFTDGRTTPYNNTSRQRRAYEKPELYTIQ